MDLILTHDNADFDAIGAMLAASKLFPEYLPVLPRHQNRNVRHFLSLYKEQLPFIAIADLPRDAAKRVTLVDTQHFQTVKGVNARTEIHVIDHHSPRDPVNPKWVLSLDNTGAATTLLVERLQEQNVRLTPVEATLIALGIYEDTGALTYGTTTPRDAQAAAWALEQGALVDVIRRAMHHPLADDQKKLYEELLQNVETVIVEGETIIIASASSPTLVEEISTVAHRLRDLLDPSALILLVELSGFVQFVARSTTEAIHVGIIATNLGGGGHGRASAAIIKDKSLEEAHELVLSFLPLSVRPAARVAGLMSTGVKTLPVDAKVKQADAQMRRYGYEGFPVTRGDTIVGLLTRRAVDRAMAHGMGTTSVGQLMEVGTVSVHPEDSVARLQQVMMSSGWGQVPVVDAEGRVIGVVTRTDLIKHFGHATLATNRRVEISTELSRALPPLLMALTQEAGRQAQELHLNLYVVGGVVRDLLLGKPLVDIDFVVEGDAIALTRRLLELYGGDIRSHDRFGTSKWFPTEDAWAALAAKLEVPMASVSELPGHIDFVTARTEYYRAPSELPEVEQSSIKHDLHRRDFTINTLAIRLDPANFGQLLDFYGGERDLRESRIRVLHSLSFVDDPTRILRAVRLEQRLGFDIEPRTGELISHALGLLEKLSGDRIRHEIEFVLAEDCPERSLIRLAQLGILRAIHPEWIIDRQLADQFAAVREAINKPVWQELQDVDLELAYFGVLTSALSLRTIEALCKRIKVQRRTVQSLKQLHALKSRLPHLSSALPPGEIDEALNGIDEAALLAAWVIAPPDAKSAISHYARHLRYIEPTITGADLKTYGLKPGPVFKSILKEVRNAWLNGEVSTSDEEQVLVASLAEKSVGDLLKEKS